MRNAKEVGEYLRNITKEKGKTAEDIAFLLDAPVEKVNGVFDGEVFINPFNNVEKLCDYLEITVHEMLDVT